MLPPALVDLTLFRLSTPSVRIASGALTTSRCASTARHVRQTVLPPPPPPPKSAYYYDLTEPRSTETGISDRRSSALESRTGRIVQDAGAELAMRVKALEELASSDENAALDPQQSFTEEELMFFYEDVLALPPSPEQSGQISAQEHEQQQIDEDLSIVCAAEERVLADEPHASSSAQARLQPYHRVLSYTRDAILRIEAARETIKRSPNAEPSISKNEFLPVSVLTVPEFRSILRLSIRAGDADAADLTLDLMKRGGLAIPEDMVNSLLKVYASAGNVSKTEQILVRYLDGPPTPHQRHFHIKSHLISAPKESLANTALELLHFYENQALPAPVQTYTSIITTLFSSNSSLGRAQAWDLFSHMRYVAHATPDPALYTLMIRACASPINTRPSEPEKALDLWTEMTVDHRFEPTQGAYDAIILACARSGKTTFVNEAFRLAKQMLDSHRDARGESAFKPSRRTYCALLEGAKRIGDLSRARWILAQMTSTKSGTDVEAVNEEVMMHVFHTYASYRPPFNRNLVKTTETIQSADVPTTSTEVSPDVSQSPPQSTSVATNEPGSAFSHIPPQSGTEVIHEVQILFDRILYDSGLKNLFDPTEGGALPAEQKFQHVELSSRLVNSYLAVHYKHAPFEDARDLYRRVFTECQVLRTGRTYVEALERCAIARRGHERTIALDFAEEVWAEWKKLEDVGHENGLPLSGRIIERAHIAMIRVLALTHNLDKAMQHLRTFAARYPPSDVRVPAPKPAMRSTRTVLVGERPLVRMTSNVEVPDDHVPPLIMFDDIEVLHHRLVARRSSASIKYIAWLSKAYEGALRARRDAALKLKPGAGENGSIAQVAAPSD
ncbi:hypothetical protein C0993_000368 [Termitomyces sp. T159_Od127]|nr:hypothetical protein C0993_000368 [Termitomyces sp. T159_Od127]